MRKFCLLLNLCLALLIPAVAYATDWCADTGLEAGYYMNEASGSLDDCSDNNNSMTATGSPGTYNTTGQFGGAFDFTQQNDTGFSSTDIAALRNMGTWSAGAWIAPDTDGDNNADRCDAGWIVGKTGEDGWGLCLDNDAAPVELTFFAYWSGGRTSWFTTTDPVVIDSTFKHVAVTYNSSSTSNDPLIYYNGVSQTVGDQTPFGSYDDDTNDEPTIGIVGDGGGIGTVNEFDGDMDEVFIYDGGAVLNSTQINDIKDNGLTAAAGGSIMQIIKDQENWKRWRNDEQERLRVAYAKSSR